MYLFKDITIKQKLQNFEIPDFDNKISIIKKWYDYYHKGTLKNDKEKEVAPEYTAEIFMNFLGYHGKTSGKTTFTSEYSLEGKFPDGVVGVLNRHEQDDKITAVVELKGAGIPLDQPQKREKNYTPIEQAFGYKRQLRNCPFVIVSNFYELRLYNDNELDYELWTLKDLLDSKDDYYHFRKFYYLLCEENLIAEKGISNTESLLSEIRIEEQEITKRFYKDYKEKRHLLLRNLYQKNEILRKDTSLLIEKGQKIIDRVIFMCFAEDRGLLPADTLQNIKRDFERSSMVNNIWDSLKIAFNYINKGNDEWGIPDGYNGGLFARDEVLDDLKIESHILPKIIDFGMYDFANELSVTILGHIFEQSISDLEEIREKIEEKGFESELETTETKKVSKRKKDGIFYTPEYIVDYIVKNSLGKYLREKETTIIEKYNFERENLKETTREQKKREAYIEYQEFLKTVKILDPACGSGAFLVRVFDYLLEEHRRVGKILGGFFNTDEIYKDILQNNIYGVDLNQESVEITKLSLWLKSAQPGKKLSNLDNNIKCGNSLIDDPKIAGDKAFKWEEEFSEIMQNDGFDVILMNPPYVNIANISNKLERDFYKKKYKTVKNKSDLYSIFVEKSYGILKDKGKLGAIFSNSWLGTDSFSKFREFLVNNTKISRLVNLPDGIFQDAIVKTILIFFEKQKTKEHKIILEELQNESFVELNYMLGYERINKTDKFLFSFNREVKINCDYEKLGNIANFSLGIKTSNDKRFISSEIKDSDSYLMLRGKNVGRYFKEKAKEYIWYKPEMMTEKVGAGPRNLTDFLQEKILIQEIAKKINGVLDKESILCNDTINILFTKNKDYSLKYFLLIINSYFIEKWFNNYYESGLHIKLNQLREIPIPKISPEDQKPFIEKADIMLELNKKFHEQKLRFLQRMIDNYELEKANKKLEKFYEMDFGDFVKEMRKKGAKIGLSTQDELEKYFDKNKAEFVELDTQIKKTDTEIDKMVYKLYKLNEEEISIIENS